MTGHSSTDMKQLRDPNISSWVTDVNQW